MTLVVTEATSEADLAHCLALRRRVFIEEQNVPEADDLDGRDATAIHLLGRLDGTPVAALRLRLLPPYGKVERVCVLPEARGTGAGAALMAAALERLRAEPGITTAKLGAQLSAVGFYDRLGFAPVGEDYLDAGIPHRDMVRAL